MIDLAPLLIGVAALLLAPNLMYHFLKATAKGTLFHRDRDEAAKRVAIERIANELRREAERRERLQRQQQAKQTTWEVYDPNHTDPYDQENDR